MKEVTVAHLVTLGDFEQMQQESAKLAELYAERSELITDFIVQLGEIDERINDETGGGGRRNTPSVVASSPNATGQPSNRSVRRTPRASNRHSLPWHLLVAMHEEGGEGVSEAVMVEKVLEMGYKTNAGDFHNSIYTTLHTMRRKDNFVKKGDGERSWDLTAKGSKIAAKNSAEWDEEKEG